MEAFPLGSSGLVDVDMRIHKSGKNRSIAKVVLLEIARHLLNRHNFADRLASHEYRCGARSFRCDHSTGDESLRIHEVNNPSNRQVWALRAEPIAPASLFQLLTIGISAGEKFRPLPASAYTCLPQQGRRILRSRKIDCKVGRNKEEPQS
jgi:hypothetical protein